MMLWKSEVNIGKQCTEWLQIFIVNKIATIETIILFNVSTYA